MNRHRRDIIASLAFAPALLAAAGSPVTAHASGQAHAFYSQTFPDLSGNDVPFSSYLGKPVVLNFWATWCPPCVKEMPDLDRLSREYPDIHFVGVAVDTQRNVLRFGEKVQVSYPLLVAGHGGIALMRELGNSKGGLPFTLVFDAAGQPLTTYLGQIHPETLDAYLKGIS